MSILTQSFMCSSRFPTKEPGLIQVALFPSKGKTYELGGKKERKYDIFSMQFSNTAPQAVKLIQNLGPKGVRFVCKNEQCFEVKQKKWTQNRDLDKASMYWLQLWALLAACLRNGLRNDNGCIKSHLIKQSVLRFSHSIALRALNNLKKSCIYPWMKKISIDPLMRHYFCHFRTISNSCEL